MLIVAFFFLAVLSLASQQQLKRLLAQHIGMGDDLFSEQCMVRMQKKNLTGIFRFEHLDDFDYTQKGAYLKFIERTALHVSKGVTAEDKFEFFDLAVMGLMERPEHEILTYLTPKFQPLPELTTEQEQISAEPEGEIPEVPMKVTVVEQFGEDDFEDDSDFEDDDDFDHLDESAEEQQDFSKFKISFKFKPNIKHFLTAHRNYVTSTPQKWAYSAYLLASDASFVNVPLHPNDRTFQSGISSMRHKFFNRLTTYHHGCGVLSPLIMITVGRVIMEVVEEFTTMYGAAGQTWKDAASKLHIGKSNQYYRPVLKKFKKLVEKDDLSDDEKLLAQRYLAFAITHDYKVSLTLALQSTMWNMLYGKIDSLKQSFGLNDKFGLKPNRMSSGQSQFWKQLGNHGWLMVQAGSLAWTELVVGRPQYKFMTNPMNGFQWIKVESRDEKNYQDLLKNLKSFFADDSNWARSSESPVSHTFYHEQKYSHEGKLQQSGYFDEQDHSRQVLDGASHHGQMETNLLPIPESVDQSNEEDVDDTFPSLQELLERRVQEEEIKSHPLSQLYSSNEQDSAQRSDEDSD